MNDKPPFEKCYPHIKLGLRSLGHDYHYRYNNSDPLFGISEYLKLILYKNVSKITIIKSMEYDLVQEKKQVLKIFFSSKFQPSGVIVPIQLAFSLFKIQILFPFHPQRKAL